MSTITKKTKHSRIKTSVFSVVKGEKPITKNDFLRKNRSLTSSSNGLANRISAKPTFRKGSLSNDIIKVIKENRSKSNLTFDAVVEKVRNLRSKGRDVNTTYKSFSYGIKRSMLQLVNHNYLQYNCDKDNVITFFIS